MSALATNLDSKRIDAKRERFKINAAVKVLLAILALIGSLWGGAAIERWTNSNTSGSLGTLTTAFADFKSEMNKKLQAVDGFASEIVSIRREMANYRNEVDGVRQIQVAQRAMLDGINALVQIELPNGQRRIEDRQARTDAMLAEVLKGISAMERSLGNVEGQLSRMNKP